MGKLFDEKGKADLKILAEGDSWFDYPAISGVKNIIDHLRKSGYKIENLSTSGHELIDMVYGTIIKPNYSYNSKQQIDNTLDKVAELKPDIVLFSGGGNDIAGIELDAFINHQKSGLPVLRMENINYTINTVFRKAYFDFFELVRGQKADVHFIIHGYANPPANGDGLGFNFKGFPFPGPWIKPAFAKKNHNNRQENEEHMKTIMGVFNSMLENLAANDDRVHYIDLRPHFNNSDWVNELHLNNAGFKRAAGLFDEVIQSL